MNFSIHLPDPLVEDLDAFAHTRQTSCSGVIQEAVREYLGTRIVASGELRVHLGMVSHGEYDDGGGGFQSAFKLSDELVIIPTFEPWFRMSDHFP